MANKKYYWLKLHRDFFKRHDVKIVESQENGKDYIIFYLKLLTECIDHEGRLRFSDELPYDERMLATITDTNVDVVRSAVKAFIAMGLMERWDDGTYFMSKIDKMIGSETQWAAKKREQRALNSTEEDNVQALSKASPRNVRQEIETELEKEKDRDKGETPKRFTPPTLEDVEEYCKEKGVDAQKWHDHYTSNGWMVGRNKMKDWKAAVRTWARNEFNTQTSQPKQEKNKKIGECDKCGSYEPLLDGLCPRCRGDFKDEWVK
jgi:predicted phage replisome organizer